MIQAIHTNCEIFDECQESIAVCVYIDAAKVWDIDHEILIWKIFEMESNDPFLCQGFVNYGDPNSFLVAKQGLEVVSQVQSYPFLDQHRFLKLRPDCQIFEKRYQNRYSAKTNKPEPRIKWVIQNDLGCREMGNQFFDYIHFDWDLIRDHAEELLKEMHELDRQLVAGNLAFLDEIDAVDGYQLDYRIIPLDKYPAIQQEIRASRPQCVRKMAGTDTILPEPSIRTDKKWYHKEYVFYYRNSFWRMVIKMGNGFFMGRVELLIQGPQFEWSAEELEERKQRHGTQLSDVGAYRVEKDQIPAEVSEFENYVKSLFDKYGL